MNICKRCFTHYNDPYDQSAQVKVHTHKIYCNSYAPLRIELPSNQPFIKFEKVERQLRVPIVIYADFESILKPIEGNNPSPNISYTREYQHVPMSFCVYEKTTVLVIFYRWNHTSIEEGKEEQM
jgi:hypothetical protein